MSRKALITIVLSVLAIATLLVVGCGEGSNRTVNPVDPGDSNTLTYDATQPGTSTPGGLDTDLDDTELNDTDPEVPVEDDLSTSVDNGSDDDPWFKEDEEQRDIGK